MHGTLRGRIEEAREIEGRLSSGRDVFVQETKLSRVCKVLWPDKKIPAHLASIAGRDERTAKRWLSGEFEPPISIVLAINAEIFGGYK